MTRQTTPITLDLIGVFTFLLVASSIKISHHLRQKLVYGYAPALVHNLSNPLWRHSRHLRYRTIVAVVGRKHWRSLRLA
jgi:hypothetical protein